LVEFQFLPSGDRGDVLATIFSATGNGSAGTLTFQLCIRYGTDTSLGLVVWVRDNANNTSNALGLTIAKPAGANALGPDGEFQRVVGDRWATGLRSILKESPFLGVEVSKTSVVPVSVSSRAERPRK
jgi:hypothetical protein